MPKRTGISNPLVNFMVSGVEDTVARLRAEAAKSLKDTEVSAVVGYSAPYALYVHEDLQTPRAKGKSAKYLERPAMAIGASLSKEVLIGNLTFAQKLLQIALKIERESQRL